MPTLKLNNCNFYYETTGEGEPLLFLHGLGSSGRDWEKQVPHFAENYQVITFDIRGHGRSEKPAGPYSIPLFASDIAAFIEALNLPPVHVVGISMGGMIAFQLAVDRPELIRTLTIVNSGPELIIRTFKERLSIWQRFLIVRLMGMRKMGEVLAGRLFPQPENADLHQLFADRWAENDKRAYLDAMRALLGWSVTEHLGEIDCPTLVVAADQDYTPLSLKEAYVSMIRNAQLVVVEDSHHALPVEWPHKFNPVLESFLNQPVSA